MVLLTVALITCQLHLNKLTLFVGTLGNVFSWSSLNKGESQGSLPDNFPIQQKIGCFCKAIFLHFILKTVPAYC